jgi:bacteriocin biosynthesis cyclodehydratase domain-containing protein
MNPRPVIAPGLPVLTRPGGELQIGLTPRYRVRIVDSAAARRTLAGLARGVIPTDQAGRRVLRRLESALRDSGSLVQPGLSAPEMAALSLRHPHTALSRLEGRRRTAVTILGDLGVDPGPLLAATGLGSGPTGRSVTLVLCQGEPDRSSLDPLLRERQPYLLLRAVEGELVLGPFVDPGRTACLRCVDAHLAEQDPAYPVLVSRGARLLPTNQLPEPVDSALATIAIGWAVRDLVRYAEGDPVSTWSATVVLGPDDLDLVPTTWMPHPACGCSWARSADQVERQYASRTMGA